MLFDVLALGNFNKPLPFCLPGFQRKDQKRHLQKASTLDDSLDTFLLLILALVTLDKLFNINNIRDKMSSIRNGKIPLFFGLKWDKNST